MKKENPFVLPYRIGMIGVALACNAPLVIAIPALLPGIGGISIAAVFLGTSLVWAWAYGDDFANTFEPETKEEKEQKKAEKRQVMSPEDRKTLRQIRHQSAYEIDYSSLFKKDGQKTALNWLKCLLIYPLVMDGFKLVDDKLNQQSRLKNDLVDDKLNQQSRLKKDYEGKVVEDKLATKDQIENFINADRYREQLFYQALDGASYKSIQFWSKIVTITLSVLILTGIILAAAQVSVWILLALVVPIKMWIGVLKQDQLAEIKSSNEHVVNFAKTTYLLERHHALIDRSLMDDIFRILLTVSPLFAGFINPWLALLIIPSILYQVYDTWNEAKHFPTGHGLEKFVYRLTGVVLSTSTKDAFLSALKEKAGITNSSNQQSLNTSGNTDISVREKFLQKCRNAYKSSRRLRSIIFVFAMINVVLVNSSGVMFGALFGMCLLFGQPDVPSLMAWANAMGLHSAVLVTAGIFAVLGGLAAYSLTKNSMLKSITVLSHPTVLQNKSWVYWFKTFSILCFASVSASFNFKAGVDLITNLSQLGFNLQAFASLSHLIGVACFLITFAAVFGICSKFILVEEDKSNQRHPIWNAFEYLVNVVVFVPLAFIQLIIYQPAREEKIDNTTLNLKRLWMSFKFFLAGTLSTVGGLSFAHHFLKPELLVLMPTHAVALTWTIGMVQCFILFCLFRAVLDKNSLTDDILGWKGFDVLKSDEIKTESHITYNDASVVPYLIEKISAVFGFK
ncbi:hypothetical protein N9Y17_02520 [Gammaproteobacteria bacterium]|nr:hypothetical protein [Gammaproteobacteria bacterium]